MHRRSGVLGASGCSEGSFKRQWQPLTTANRGSGPIPPWTRSIANLQSGILPLSPRARAGLRLSSWTTYGKAHGPHDSLLRGHALAHQLRRPGASSARNRRWSASAPQGYIAQVWTGTARTPNVYDGERKERTFETAFLEYGAMQNLVRASRRRIWYLNDPVADSPNNTWDDYRSHWQSTLTASLLMPEVSSYEIMPWPQRVFTGMHPATEQDAEKLRQGSDRRPHGREPRHAGAEDHRADERDSQGVRDRTADRHRGPRQHGTIRRGAGKSPARATSAFSSPTP